MSLPRFRTLASLLVFLALPGLTVPASGQATTAAFDPSTVSSRVEIGPVAGWTTTWHPAPLVTGAPLGATLLLRVRVPPGADAQWTGAREVETRQGRSIAEVVLANSNLRRVEVRVIGSDGESEAHTLTFEPVSLAGDPVFERPGLAVEPLEIDADSPNASTMALYFQGSSIAALGSPEPWVYRTSTNRWLTLESRVVPEALAPLVEWRLNGKVLSQLGSRVRLQVFTTGRHTLTAGSSDAVSLETYRVRLTSPRRGEPIPTGIPVTFTAETDPPGFETEITWLASTKYGHCEPLLGRGPEFTTTFSQTVGESGSWLGVRADDAVLGLDRKNDDCASFQRTAEAALPQLVPPEALPTEPASLRRIQSRIVELTTEASATSFCSTDRIEEVSAELEGLHDGFMAGLDLGSFDLGHEPCLLDCRSELSPACSGGPDNPLCELVCLGTCSPRKVGPDLSIFGEDTEFCNAENMLRVRVRNRGNRTSGPTIISWSFTTGGIFPIRRDVPVLSPGAFIDIGPIEAPTGCFSAPPGFTPTCSFEVCISRQEDELVTGNECTVWSCPPPH